MVIYIVRHGETLWNVQRRLQGRKDIELNENGRLLAQKAADMLRDVPFTACFSSPLRRAVETAEIILGERNVPICTDERIIEISFGSMEGFDGSSAQPGFSDAYWNFFHAPEKYIPAEGGETLENLCSRTKEFLLDITSRPELEEETVLVTSHGAAMRALLNALREFSVDDFWGSGLLGNCEAAILESRGGRVWFREADSTRC